MKQFGTIFKFELNNYFKNKIFVGVTIFLVAVIAVVMYFPRFFGSEDSGSPEDSGNLGNVEAEGEETAGSSIDGMMLFSASGVEGAEAVCQALDMAFPDYAVCMTDDDLDTIKDKVISGEAECAFVMDGLMSYTYYVNNLSIYDSNTAVADEVLGQMYTLNALTASGMSAEEAGQVLSVQINHETESLGKDQMQNFFYTYIMIFALYMVILLYGQMVATNVATEKSSRAMEAI